MSKLLIFLALFRGGHAAGAVVILGFLTVILFVFIKNLCGLLFSEGAPSGPAAVPPAARETVSQFALLSLCAVLGFVPPAGFTRLVEAAAGILPK